MGSDLTPGNLWARLMIRHILGRLGSLNTEIKVYLIYSVAWNRMLFCRLVIMKAQMKEEYGEGLLESTEKWWRKGNWSFLTIFQCCGFTVFTNRTEYLGFVLSFSTRVFLEELWTTSLAVRPLRRSAQRWLGTAGRQRSEVELWGLQGTGLPVWRVAV